jgi:putative DNA primase/helicase
MSAATGGSPGSREVRITTTLPDGTKISFYGDPDDPNLLDPFDGPWMEPEDEYSPDVEGEPEWANVVRLPIAEQRITIAARPEGCTKAPEPQALWHTPDGEPWATIGPRHLRVRSNQFREWLARQLYQSNGEAASKYKVDELVSVYAARATFDGPEHRVYLRRARAEDAIWLDLADAEGRAVRISKDGWQVMAAREVLVRFDRPPNMRALPEPLCQEADLDCLRPLLNLSDKDTFRLLLTWLSFAILPDEPYPIIAVSGPAGAAKSSFAEFVRNIIDPSAVPLLGVPRGQDLVADAKNNAVLCFDNLSTISPSLADDLCRLATGGGMGGRKLYTDDAEATFNASRPMVLTGINEVTTRGDLADRTIVVRLEAIPESGRRTAAEMREEFEYAHPRVLAGLLDTIVLALRPNTEVKERRRPLPRMADFGEWGFAIAPRSRLDGR